MSVQRHALTRVFYHCRKNLIREGYIDLPAHKVCAVLMLACQRVPAFAYEQNLGSLVAATFSVLFLGHDECRDIDA